jgi:hypothetical protein
MSPAMSDRAAASRAIRRAIEVVFMSLFLGQGRLGRGMSLLAWQV